MNYQVESLIEYKEEYLKEWIGERVKKKGVRLYTEATFFFDE